MSHPERLHRLTAGLVFLCAFVLYLLTMAPTTSFWDCGEFIASSYTLSIPHPPGAPFYLLLGRIFTMVPFLADIGARVNFISVLSSALTVMLLYLSVIHLIRYWKSRDRMGWSDYAGAAIGALVFMASDSFWFNAVEAEVYAISMLFTALVVWLALVWHARVDSGTHDGRRILLLIFYLVGLAIGVHLLNVLALPMVFMIMYFHERPNDKPLVMWGWLLLCTLAILPIYPGIVQQLPKLIEATGVWMLPALFIGMGLVYWQGQRTGHPWLSLGSAAAILVVLGYLSYIVILLRSGLNPPLDENDPETIQGLIAYLGREQYGVSQGFFNQYFERVAPFWDYQVRHMYLRYLGWNFIGRDHVTEAVSWGGLFGLPLLLGLWGVVTHFVRDWRRALVILALFFLTGLAIVLYLNQPDPQPRERDYSYVGSFFAFSLWVGIGAAALLEDLASAARRAGRVLVPLLAVLLLVALPARMVAVGYHVHDRSGNYVAHDYARNALEMLEPDAILFTNGDNDTFPLWYLQEVEGVRKDVRVVNLSLLNTGWYIRQLRDVEPRVPLHPRFTDEFIARRIDGAGEDALLWRYWGPRVWTDREGKPLPREDWYKVPLRDSEGNSYPITVEPTLGIYIDDNDRDRNLLRVQDRMIIEIVRAAEWKRPVYFAVTVAGNSFVGLREYLRMDGLAFKVMDHKVPGSGIDRAVIDRNLQLFEQNFRNLDDPSVYYTDNIRKLVQNYRSCYIQLALELQATEPEAALAYLQRMERFLPEEVAPSFSPDLALNVGELLARLGDTTALRQRLDFVGRWPGGLAPEQRFALAYAWLDHFDDEERMLAEMAPLLEADRRGDWHLQTGLAFEQANRPAEAIEWYRRVLQIDSQDRDAMVALIRASERSGDYETALKVLDDWIAANPGDTSALERRERVLAGQEAARDTTP